MSRPRLLFGGLMILVFGGFVLWLQIGLLYAVGTMAAGAYGLQNHLSAAAAGLQSGEYLEAQEEFAAAQEATRLLDRSAGVRQLDVLELVPGVDVATENWRLLVSSAGDITDSTGDLIALYGDLSGKGGGEKIFTDGAIDLARLQDLPDRVNVASAQLESASVALMAVRADTAGSTLLDQVRNKALTEMEPVQQALNALQRIAPVLPDALGANGVRRYLVAIGNQAEMRAAGGAPLTLVLVEFNDGRISIPIKGPTSTQLFPPLNASVTWWGPAANPFFPGNPRNAPFVVTNTHPNMLFSAREMAGAWAGGDYPPVDGVVTLDLTAIAAVLDQTGPMESPVYGTVDGSRLGQILLIDAYQTFGQEGAAERQEANQELLNALLDRLLSGEDLVSAAQAIASTAPGRHVQMWMRNPELQRLALDSGAAGVVSDPGVGDWSAMYTQNGNQSKVDVFQQRHVTAFVQLAADGSAKVTQQLIVANATPPERPEGPPERVGYETSWLKAAYIMYVPDAAFNYRASYPSSYAVRPFKNHPQLGRGWVDDGFGHRMIRVVGWTSPGGENSMTVSYELPPGTFTDAETGGLTYRMRAEPQSLWNPSTVTAQVTPPAGFVPVPQPGMEIQDATVTFNALQAAPVDVMIPFTRS